MELLTKPPPVVEHVDDPLVFLKEQSRVALRGYIETPSILGEYLMPKISHKWLLQEIDGKIIMYEKERVGFHTWQNFGYVFLDYLPKHSLGYKLMQRTHNDITNVTYEWSEEIEVLINPDSSYYYDLFTNPWNEATCKKLLSQNSIKSEVISVIGAAFDVFRTYFGNKINNAQKKLCDPVIK